MVASINNNCWDCIVVGAGISGLMAARKLKDAGFKVLVLDKARGVGGRMATRRIESAVFDHGAQFFTARDSQFQEIVNNWIDAGAVKSWFLMKKEEAGDETMRYIGVKSMTSLPKYLASDIDVQLNSRVISIKSEEGCWKLHAETGDKIFGHSLLITTPVPQGLDLLSDVESDIAQPFLDQLRKVRYAPCFTLMLMLDGPSGINAPGFQHSPAPGIACMTDNSLKGISPDAYSVTVHATVDYSTKHFDEEPDLVAEQMFDAVSHLLDSSVKLWEMQRWNYSKVITWLSEPFLLSESPVPIAYAGDAFVAPRVEGAALSGNAAGDALVAYLKKKQNDAQPGFLNRFEVTAPHSSCPVYAPHQSGFPK